MHFFRHLIALAMLCGFGYLYLEKQKQPAALELKHQAEDPFAHFEQAEEAPRFESAAPSAAPFLGAPAIAPIASETVPKPIPFPDQTQANPHSKDLIANLTQWSETLPQNMSKLLSTDVDSAQTAPSGKQQKTITTPKNIPPGKPTPGTSIWTEPSITQSNQTPANKTPSNQTGVKKTSPHSPLFDPFEHYGKQEQPAAAAAKRENKPNSAPAADSAIAGRAANPETPQAKTPEPQKSTPPTEIQPAVRQFTLGNGSQKIVCVLDESVSQDGLLLSSLFTGLRREWSGQSAQHQNQTLIMLISDAKQGTHSEREAQIQARLQELNPHRVVRVVHGSDSRGWLRFSQDEESIAALMSVPGVYRIAGFPQNTDTTNSKTASSSYSQIRMELPRELTSQESATVELLATALVGDWSAARELSYTGKAKNLIATAPQASEVGTETTSHFFNKLYEESLKQKAEPQKPAVPEIAKKAAPAETPNPQKVNVKTPDVKPADAPKTSPESLADKKPETPAPSTLKQAEQLLSGIVEQSQQLLEKFPEQQVPAPIAPSAPLKSEPESKPAATPQKKTETLAEKIETSPAAKPAVPQSDSVAESAKEPQQQLAKTAPQNEEKSTPAEIKKPVPSPENPPQTTVVKKEPAPESTKAEKPMPPAKPPEEQKVIAKTEPQKTEPQKSEPSQPAQQPAQSEVVKKLAPQSEELASVDPSSPMTRRLSSPVEILPPPPMYRAQKLSPANEQGVFYKLPAPPNRK